MDVIYHPIDWKHGRCKYTYVEYNIKILRYSVFILQSITQLTYVNTLLDTDKKITQGAFHPSKNYLIIVTLH